MTTPNVHPFWQSWCRDEFGAHDANIIWLSWYYADGVLVPVGTVGANGAIPSSGYITLDHLRNASKNKYTGNLVAGAAGNVIGYWWDAGIGSISPDTLLGVGFRTVSWNTSSQIVIQMWSDMGNGGWENFIVDGIHNLARVNAAYSISQGGSTWVWGGAGQVFNNGQNHSIVFR